MIFQTIEQIKEYIFQDLLEYIERPEFSSEKVFSIFVRTLQTYRESFEKRYTENNNKYYYVGCIDTYRIIDIFGNKLIVFVFETVCCDYYTFYFRITQPLEDLLLEVFL